MNYAEARQFLDQFPRFEVKPGLARIRSLLQALGDPQCAYPTIHVGGTNGKGSVVAMLDAILRATGRRVGRFTSPELMDFHDRIAVDGRWIEEQELADIVSVLRPLIEALDEVPSQFEIITAIAFEQLRRARVDVAVIEVGLGGRYDATNVIAPELAILTNVSLDHQKILGETVEQIAWEKAGIAKQGVPLIIGRLQESVQDIVAKEGADVGATMHLASDVLIDRVSRDWDGLRVKACLDGEELRLQLPLIGGIQVENLRLVLAAVHILRMRGYTIASGALEQGLSNVHWPGRLEVVHQTPTVVIDGAHNVAAAEALAADVCELVPDRDRRLLLYGSFADKNVDGVLQALAGAFERIAVCAPGSPRAISLEQLRNRAQAFFPEVAYHRSVCAGVREILAKMTTDDVLVVTGSLTVAAEGKRCLSSGI